MCETAAVPLGPPRLERRDGFLLAGLMRRHILALDLSEILLGVSRQWHSLHALKHGIPRSVDRNYYGICLRIHEGDMGFDYFCGMEVAGAEQLPGGLTALTVPPLRCAVFRYAGRYSRLVDAYFTIFGKLLPEAGLKPAEGAPGVPDFIECFDEGYDLKTKRGGPVIMVPLKD